MAPDELYRLVRPFRPWGIYELSKRYDENPFFHILGHVFSLLSDHLWSLLRLQVYLLGWFVNLRAVLCMTHAGTLRFELAAFINRFFFGYGLWLDMVSTSS
jgi:hypothetical protein